MDTVEASKVNHCSITKYFKISRSLAALQLATLCRLMLFHNEMMFHRTTAYVLIDKESGNDCVVLRKCCVISNISKLKNNASECEEMHLYDICYCSYRGVPSLFPNGDKSIIPSLDLQEQSVSFEQPNIPCATGARDSNIANSIRIFGYVYVK